MVLVRFGVQMRYLKLVMSVFMLASCSNDTNSDSLVAIVNGQKIFKSGLMDFFSPHNRPEDISHYFVNLREKAVSVELIHQKAVKEIQADDKEVKAELDRVTEALLVDAYKQKLLKDALSDSSLKKQYDKFVQDNPAEGEVRAKHILVDDEALAKQILAELEKGGSFEALSEAHSKDKAANAQKGDLGYFRASDMVKPFADKAFELREKMIAKLGRDHFHETSGLRDIVKTQFGWHVIEILGSRQSSHPPLPELKPQLESEITKEILEKETDRLKEKTKIEILPLPKEKQNEIVLVTIGDKTYKKADLLAMIPNAEPDFDVTPFYDKLASEFVKRKLLGEEATKAISLKEKDIQAELNKTRKRILVNLYLERYIKSHINEQKLQEDYKTWLSTNTPQDEVHARHILVATEEEANQIVKQLSEGNDFAKLANEKSKDKGAKGGDLGYFTKDVMVPEFSKKAFSLEPAKEGQKGELGVVKSTFGWHIIEVLDKRQTKTSSFEEMKSELESEQAQKLVDDHIASLKNEAKIELFDLQKGDKKQEPKSPAEKPQEAKK